MTLAIIGGTGLDSLDTLTITRREPVSTPFGDPAAALSYGVIDGEQGPVEALFLPRHGDHHTLPPHLINYRANVWALKQAGVRQVIAVAAVGGITPAATPGRLVFPDQLIDYTYGREHTFFHHDTEVSHVDFTDPYSASLRRQLIDSARSLQLDAGEHGVYGATQGPRLETAAEIRRMERDGCDLVGMTGMPEAGLAREADLAYACCAVVVNWAAGKGGGPITMDEIGRHLTTGMAAVKRLLSDVLPRLQSAA